MAIVTIIMGTFNRAHLISETLESILNQSLKNWECLIIDDGSNDDTAKVVEKFTSKDPRFSYLQRTREYKKGLPGCRNQGLDLAKGEFIVFFDDDDIPHPQLLQLTVAELKKSDHDFCRYLRSTFMGRFSKEFILVESYSTKKIGQKKLEAVIMNDLPFNSCQIMWRKSSIGKSRFDENLMYAEEWEFYTRILSTGLEGNSINKELYFGRKHPNSNTGEFYRKEPIRLSSQIQAASLVINNLASKKLFSETLKFFFLRMGFELKSFNIIKLSLKAANAGVMEKWKYKIGFQIYPVLKPIFYLKAKILKS
ncbi:Glycosyltransferase involved in cell wall bisynthesis [Salegentibacter holothuriorum]|uniref:Glycosyltransferase involved in cell wall bisynthesis n=1 Tax=Salegentibacter holothuriorum TaxID=241145 RepID=A0A1T5CM56_9FLAO|nr:glycosyltransferase family 2 protein [Salegentibacter holothuriorum]SKB60240.1 Glycosyltransferase involved in cell wall bisynthesis [Salegentibacter holothuriorum]